MAEKKELGDILSSIDELAKRGQITRNRAFAAWFAINFFSLDEDEALEAAAADGGNDQGIDLAFVDDTSEEIVVLQAYCPENIDKKTPKNKWDAVVSSLPFIKDPASLAKSGRPDLADALRTMKDDHPEHTIEIGLISLGLKSQEIVDSVTAHQNAVKNEGLDFFYLSQEDLKAKYKALVNSEGGITEDTLTFSGNYIQDVNMDGRGLAPSALTSCSVCTNNTTTSSLQETFVYSSGPERAELTSRSLRQLRRSLVLSGL